MKNQLHFKELLKLLEENNVDYVIVGGYAVAFHGFPRFTKDLDIFYRNSSINIKKLHKALLDFGFSDSDLDMNMFEQPGTIIQFGISPLRIDIMNDIDGVTIDEALSHCVHGKYGEIPVKFIGLKELIKNKRSSGRPQDKLDADNLEKKYLNNDTEKDENK